MAPKYGGEVFFLFPLASFSTLKLPHFYCSKKAKVLVHLPCTPWLLSCDKVQFSSLLAMNLPYKAGWQLSVMWTEIFNGTRRCSPMGPKGCHCHSKISWMEVFVVVTGRTWEPSAPLLALGKQYIAQLSLSQGFLEVPHLNLPLNAGQTL